MLDWVLRPLSGMLMLRVRADEGCEVLEDNWKTRRVFDVWVVLLAEWLEIPVRGY